MDVFVTGATGVLGRATVPLLIAAGHRVRGLARSEENQALLRRIGAEPVRADLFDPGWLRVSLEGSDAVLHLATKIPPVTRMGRTSAWAENDRIRREGTHNLVEAALAAAVGTLVYPSVTLVYPDSGDRWVDAETPADPTPVTQSTLESEAEVARFTAAGGRGIVLRLGSFYSPDAASTQAQLALARRGISPIPGAPHDYLSLIWVDDAASAVVAALTSAPAGIYDVVDDEPMRGEEIDAVLAHSIGRRKLYRVPLFAMRLIAPAAARAFRSQRVSNRRFKEVTGWTPSVRSVRDGWPLVVASDLARGDDRSVHRLRMADSVPADVASGRTTVAGVGGRGDDRDGSSD